MWRLITLDNPTPEEAAVFSKVEVGCIICHKGEIDLSVDGKDRKIGQGEMFLYPPYSKVSVGEVRNPARCLICEVDYEFVLSAMKTISWSTRLQYISRSPVVTLSAESSERINQIVKLISGCQDDDQGQLAALSTDGLLRVLTYEVFRAYMEKTDLPAGNRTSRDSIAVIFQENLKSDAVRFRDVRHYAQLQGLTPRYFSTAIRELTGYSPSYWISRAVIAEARNLMLDSTLSLKEITYRLNFRSQTFFSRWYHKYAGETPSQFRKKKRIHST